MPPQYGKLSAKVNLQEFQTDPLPTFVIVAWIATGGRPCAFAQGPVEIGAGYTQPAPLVVAPGQLVTVYINLGTLTSPIQATNLPLSSSLGGLQAEANVLFSPSFLAPIPVPILAAFPVQLAAPGVSGVTLPGPSVNAVTVQIPFELKPPLGSVDSQSRVLLNISPSDQPTLSAQIALLVQSDAIHIIRVGDTLTSPTDAHGSFGVSPGLLPPSITHANGALVTVDNPAYAGETVVVWAVGLGLPFGGVAKTGSANSNPPLMKTIDVDFDFRSNAGPSMPSTTDSGGSHVPASKATVYFVPGFVGLYQINVPIPRPPILIESCGGVFHSNLTINLGGTTSFAGGEICVGR